MSKVNRHTHDLEKLLDEASKIIPSANLYQRPKIKWSKDYRMTILGEYVYGKNTIIVSRILDSDKVSRDALLQLICHELLHQEYAGEEENDAALIKIMDISALRALRDSEINFQSEFVPGMNIFPVGEDVLFCFVSPQTFNSRTVTVNDYGRYNYILSDVAKGDDIECVDKRVFPLVILITFYEGTYYIAGWLTDAIYYAKIQKSQHKKFGFYNFSYNLRTFNMGCNLFFQNNLIPFELNSDPDMDSILKQIRKQGFSVVSYKYDWVLDCVSAMNSYSSELYRPGMCPEAIHDISPILSKNISEIVALVYQKTDSSYYQGVCLANKAVSLERNYETMMAQGFAFHMAGYLDESLTAYREAISFDGTRVEPYIYALRILCMMNRKEEAALYVSTINACWNLTETKIDKNILDIYDVCVRHLRMDPLPEIYGFEPSTEDEA